VVIIVAVETLCVFLIEGDWYHSDEDERCSVWFQ